MRSAIDARHQTSFLLSMSTCIMDPKKQFSPSAAQDGDVANIPPQRPSEVNQHRDNNLLINSLLQGSFQHNQQRQVKPQRSYPEDNSAFPQQQRPQTQGTAGQISSLSSFSVVMQQPLIDPRIIKLLPHLSAFGMLGDFQHIPIQHHASRQFGQTAGSQQQQPPGYQMLANPPLLDRVAFPLSGTLGRLSVNQSTSKIRGGTPERTGEEKTLQVVPLSEKEKKSGFPLPAASGPGNPVIVGSLTRYRRIWSRLTQHTTAGSRGKVKAKKFVPEYFACSIGREKNTGHLYRKIHHLPGQDEAARPHKRARSASSKDHNV
ncbi:hypothetical protein ACA910_014272 [Epithemia clementina (nom. ined.)]